MTWIAITTPETYWTDLDEPLLAHTTRDIRFLTSGAIMLETKLTSSSGPQRLFGFEHSAPWSRSFAVHAIPGAGVALIIRTGEEIYHTTMDFHPAARMETLRVTLCWDVLANSYWLTLESPEGAGFKQQDIAPLPPMLREDLAAFSGPSAQGNLCRDVLFLAVSDCPVTTGPAPSISLQAPVETPTGPVPMGLLAAGDIVETSFGAMPVQFKATHDVPALGTFRPILLRAPYFGLTQDVVVSASQRLLVGGAEVEYMFGREAVLINAGSLVKGSTARDLILDADEMPVMRYAQLVLPRHVAPRISGAEMESLFVGRLRRKSGAYRRSCLGACPMNTMPEHVRDGTPVLDAFEAAALLEARAA